MPIGKRRLHWGQKQGSCVFDNYFVCNRAYFASCHSRQQMATGQETRRFPHVCLLSIYYIDFDVRIEYFWDESFANVFGQ